MKTFALEYAVLPCLGPVYFYGVAELSWPAVFFNNAILTLTCACASWLRSRQLAGVVLKKQRLDRLEPVWPFLMTLTLLLFAALQLIAAVTHLSYFRNGPLVRDMFDA